MKIILLSGIIMTITICSASPADKAAASTITNEDSVPAHTFSATCVGRDFPLNDPHIDACIMDLNGRYPESGNVVNKGFRGLVHILAGTGTITIDDVEHPLRQGNVFLILPGKKHHWDGTSLKLFRACTPPFDSTSHTVVD